MKTLHFFFLLSSLLLFSGASFSQTSAADLLLREEFSGDDCESLLHHLDFLAIDVREKPEYKGLIVLYEGKNKVENEHFRRAIPNYYKQFEFTNYEIITGKSDSVLKIEFWLSRNNAKPIEDEPVSDLKLDIGHDPSLFATSALRLVNINGNVTYMDELCVVCCISSFEPKLLADFLRSNPDLSAQFLIRSKDKKTAKRIETVLKDEFISNDPILESRASFKYGGKPKVDYEYPEDDRDGFSGGFAEVEIWLYPQSRISAPN